jgi:hypothetical protein
MLTKPSPTPIACPTVTDRPCSFCGLSGVPPRRFLLRYASSESARSVPTTKPTGCMNHGGTPRLPRPATTLFFGWRPGTGTARRRCGHPVIRAQTGLSPNSSDSASAGIRGYAHPMRLYSKLTSGIYTKVHSPDQDRAIALLPNHLPEPEEVAATGTDGVAGRIDGNGKLRRDHKNSPATLPAQRAMRSGALKSAHNSSDESDSRPGAQAQATTGASVAVRDATGGYEKSHRGDSNPGPELYESSALAN